ncbi:helix-turn-helix domain-containing protein [Streptomyces sp. NPDC004237]|uniref:helix-turn-helix domain-containing protein n=1 Tax=Streptomyces sp. NPDC004237 TaxID=3154455 RepID=UPI00339F1F9F
MTSLTPPAEQTTRLPRIPRGTRLKGAQAAEFSTLVVAAYADHSIRAICKETGRSYGAIYRLLSRAGVTFRNPGYPRPAAAAKSVACR